MSTTSIELPPDLLEAIRSAAKRSGQPEHELIVEALRGWFAAPTKHTSGGIAEDAELQPEMAEGRSGPEWHLEDLESLGVAEDAELSGADVKDWLKANWRPS